MGVNNNWNGDADDAANPNSYYAQLSYLKGFAAGSRANKKKKAYHSNSHLRKKYRN